MNLSELWKSENVISRSICPENPTGAKAGGALAVPGEDSPASELGQGWKVRPSIRIASGETVDLADIAGEGMIKYIWCTSVIETHDTIPYFGWTNQWRDIILRFYWDDAEFPSVECPIGDFFASGWGQYAQISSIPVCVNPGSAFNCYWEMPFKKHCKITMENRSKFDSVLYYQISYELRKLPDEIQYFHACFHRENPTTAGGPFVILDKVSGRGKYVGTYMCWGTNSNGWWGEGEIKFYMDGDKESPTICGTGTEDYFGGSYNFENFRKGQYQEYTTPYSGLSQVLRPDGVYVSQTRFGMYKWHITDPVYFEKDLKVDMQVLGWHTDRKFKKLRDDVAATAFYYMDKPTKLTRQLQDHEELEVL